MRDGNGDGSFEERREHPRVSLSGSARCVLEVDGCRHEFAMDDASLGGMRIRTTDTSLFDRMEIGAQAVVRSVTFNGSPMETGIQATIIWVADMDEKMLAGLSMRPCDVADLFMAIPTDLKEF